MIDIENLVFREVKEAVLNCDNSATVYGDYINAPESFPCVYVTEDSNITYEPSLDAEQKEHHAKILYAVNIYADNAGNKKSVAKKLLDAVDNAMIFMGFTRITCNRLPNEDRTIYRIMARYQAIVGEEVYDPVRDCYVNRIYKQ